MVLSIDETFYLAVPDLGDGDGDVDDIGSLVFYLEEPSGRLYSQWSRQSVLRNQFQSKTQWARSVKKGFTRLYRSVAKKIGVTLRVAVCDKPLHLKVSSFAREASSAASAEDGSPVVES